MYKHKYAIILQNTIKKQVDIKQYCPLNLLQKSGDCENSDKNYTVDRRTHCMMVNVLIVHLSTSVLHKFSSSLQSVAIVPNEKSSDSKEVFG